MVLRDPNNPRPSNEVPAGQPARKSRAVWWIVLAVVIAISAVVFGIGVYKLGWSGPTTRIVTRLIPYPAAIVNGSVIRWSEFEEDALTLERFYAEARKTAPPGSTFPTEAEMRTRVLDRLIKDKLAEQAAARYGIVVRDEDVEHAYATTVLDQSGLDSDGGRVRAETRAEETLEELYGLRPAQFKERILKPFLIRQKLEERLSKDEELNAEKRRKAEAALADLQAGKPFREVAAAYSEDPNAATNGGDRGWIVPGLMPPEIDEVILNMKKGETSIIIPSAFGYHIFYAADVKVADGKTASIKLSEIIIKPISLDAYLDAQLKTADVIKFVPGQ